VFDPDDPTRILAVLDWELTTVGDPLGDLAYSCLGHYIPATGFLKRLSLLGRDNSFSGGGDIPDGVPTVNEIIRIYYNELNNIQYRVSNETLINDQNRNVSTCVLQSICISIDTIYVYIHTHRNL
jgi:hypothetical protein